MPQTWGGEGRGQVLRLHAEQGWRFAVTHPDAVGGEEGRKLLHDSEGTRRGGAAKEVVA